MNKGAIKLQEYMQKKGLSQLAIAKECGVTQGFVSLLLRGKETPGAMLAYKLGKIIKSIQKGDWWEEV